jgi:putative heme-binding domain-containing protein
LTGWRQYEPSLRAEVLHVLLSRPTWTEDLLNALGRGEVAASQIALPFQQRMLGTSQKGIRERAEAVFSSASERKALGEVYRQVLELEGDTAKGALLFAQNCATCHHLHGTGVHVGPDLAALGNKSVPVLLTAILDPNQAIEARYVNYTAATRNGRELNGIIAAETAASVTFRTSGGLEETILRSDLEEMSSAGLSLMPEGLEKVLTAQELADLIAFLQRSK